MKGQGKCRNIDKGMARQRQSQMKGQRQMKGQKQGKRQKVNDRAKANAEAQAKVMAKANIRRDPYFPYNRFDIFPIDSIKTARVCLSSQLSRVLHCSAPQQDIRFYVTSLRVFTRMHLMKYTLFTLFQLDAFRGTETFRRQDVGIGRRTQGYAMVHGQAKQGHRLFLTVKTR